jgi:hypothetical protein
MIEKINLNLNHRVLCDLRQNIYNNFLALEKTNGESDEDIIKYLLNEDVAELEEFHSMLKYLFPHLFLA